MKHKSNTSTESNKDFFTRLQETYYMDEANRELLQRENARRVAEGWQYEDERAERQAFREEYESTNTQNY